MQWWCFVLLVLKEIGINIGIKAASNEPMTM